MSNDREFESAEQTTREFFERLSLNKLRMLMNSPMAPIIMEHCAESEKLAQMVQQIFDDEFDQMSAEESERWDRPVVTQESFCREQPQTLVEFPQAAPSAPPERFKLPLAASSKGQRSEINRADGLVRFATVTIDGSTFVFEEDRATGVVFLTGVVPDGVTHLYLGKDSYELRRTAQDRFKLVGAGLIRIERFVGQHEQDPATYEIRFDREHERAGDK